MTQNKNLLGLDVGTVRIGVAMGDSGVRIAIPHGVVDVDGTEVQSIAELVIANEIDTIIVGFPRNQSGDATDQTSIVEGFVAKLEDLDAEIVYQDESLTSVLAEKRLIAIGKPYTKGDIDSEAAVIILQDYMERRL